MTPELAKQFPKSYEAFFESRVKESPFRGEFTFEKGAGQKFQFNSIRGKDTPYKISCEFRDGYFYYSISSNENMCYSGCSEYIWGADGKIPIEEIEEINIFHEKYQLFDGKVRIKIKRNKITHCNMSYPCYRTEHCPLVWENPEYYYLFIHFATRDYQMYSKYGQEVNKKVKEYESLARSIGISDEEVKIKIQRALKNVIHARSPYEFIENIGFEFVKCPHCGTWHEVKYSSNNKKMNSFWWRCHKKGKDYKVVFEVDENNEITFYNNFDDPKYMREKVLAVGISKKTLEIAEITTERRTFMVKASEYVTGEVILPNDGEYEDWKENYWRTKVYEDIIKRYQRLEQIKQDS